MRGSQTFLGEVRGLGHECALSVGCPHTAAAGSLSRTPSPGRAQPPSQEALGVGRACGNDFIGKACDIFSPPVCGSWRKLEVAVISVSLAAGAGEPGRGGYLYWPARRLPGVPHGDPCHL